MKAVPIEAATIDAIELGYYFEFDKDKILEFCDNDKALTDWVFHYARSSKNAEEWFLIRTAGGVKWLLPKQEFHRRYIITEIENA